MGRTPRTLLIIAYLLLWAPGLQSVIAPFSEVPLYGFERATSRPKVSAPAIWNGRFQRKFESWFDANLGFRGAMVRSENQLNWSVFGDLSARTRSRLVPGNGRQIFEHVYLTDQNREQLLDPDALRERVEQLHLLQERLAARGIAFLLLISPSKASFLADSIAARYRRPERWDLPRNVDVFSAALVDFGVNHFDAREWLAGAGAIPDRPVFPCSGTHWTTLHAFRVAGEVMRRLEALLGRELADLEFAGETSTAQPRAPDHDLAELANVWNTRSLFEPAYYYPRWLPDESVEAPIAALVVGGSFTLGPLKFLRASGAFRQLDFFWYYNRRAAIDWEREAFAWDVILIEVNEAEVADVGFGFVADALARLE